MCSGAAVLLLVTALVCAAPAAPPAEPPRPVVVLDVGAVGVVDGLGKDEFDAVSARVAAAFQRNPDLRVVDGDAACADDACAAAAAAASCPGGAGAACVVADVVWGTLAKNGRLFLLDLHLHEEARGGSIVRARLEAPDLETLGLQIDDAAVRMVGGEPVRDFPVGVVVGGVIGGLGAIAAVVGGAGVVWALATDDRTADDLFVVSAVTGAVGVVAFVTGTAIVGGSVEE